MQGSNGHKAAEYARINFPKLVNESKDSILADAQSGLNSVFARINEGMNEAVDTVDTYMSGTPAGIVIVYSSHGGVGTTVIAANVGDSRVVLAKIGGEGVPLSM